MLGTGAAPAAGLTRLFAAPEQLMGQQCTVSADMYAFGLLLVSLLTGQMAEARGSWRLPRAPEDCPQVGWGSTHSLVGNVTHARVRR